MRNYRTAFVAAVLANIALIAILGGLWWRSSRRPKMQAAMAAGANETTQNSPNGLESTQMAPHEVALVPIQLSPERLQSIGVRMGHVESKIVDDEIRVTGNVAVDETRLSYVQLRYSGYIQKVFADATYQYLNKGQPLFTIYSPDLVATEREYLVAKQNQRHVAQSTVPGVTESAASLLEAATERLKQWGVPQREIARLESTGQVQQDLEITPGMFLNVALKVPMGKKLVIPASGVLQSGTRQVVFVNRGDGYLEPRDVELGARAGDDFIVLKGLKEGEEVVTSANFLIDSESQLQAALGSFVPPPPGAGSAGAMNAPGGM